MSLLRVTPRSVSSLHSVSRASTQCLGRLQLLQLRRSYFNNSNGGNRALSSGQDQRAKITGFAQSVIFEEATVCPSDVKRYVPPMLSQQKKVSIGAIRLELDNQRLDSVDIAYEEWGQVGDPLAPTVLVFPSLSVGSHARSSRENPTPGWWESMIGAGLGIDTDRFRVICPSNLGAPFGSTSANTGLMEAFPTITPRDIAKGARKLLSALRVSEVHAVVGASLGGCIALQFAADYPEITKKLVAISCTGRTSPGSIALRHIQREAVRSDPDFHGGAYESHGVKPLTGMRIARQLGMITYRTLEEFDERFNWFARPPYSWHSNRTFEVEEYLVSKADQFAEGFDANCYLTMSKCIDLMNLGRGYDSYAQGCSRLTCDTLLIGVKEDVIIPFEQIHQLHSLLKALDRRSTFLSHSSIRGHDAFLVDMEFFVPALRGFL